jgi:16S rRNA (guanine966-N2)-methyltransferase
VKRSGIRVIAGSARGRRLTVPHGYDVRPTKDMVREAVFAALDARRRVQDAAVLDLYAGSGALGIEALSRGAAQALFVEIDRVAAAAIQQNLETLGFTDRARLARADAAHFLATEVPREAPFDLVLADPPYEMPDAEAGAFVAALGGSGWLAADALVVLERPAGSRAAAATELPTTWERTFGDTLVVFLTTRS